MNFGDKIRSMTNSELSVFLGRILSCCHSAGYHGNNIDSDGFCYCDDLDCPLRHALSFQKQIESQRALIDYGYYVACGQEAIKEFLDSEEWRASAHE